MITFKESFDLQETHRVMITVSDPNHPTVAQRKEKIQKTVRVKGDNEGHAVDSAIAHYKNAGYKVHDHAYIGTTVKEETMNTDLKEQATWYSKEKFTADAEKKHGKITHTSKDKDGRTHYHVASGQRVGMSDKDAEGDTSYTVHTKLREETIDEVSMATLTSYKKKAGEQASAADKAGDFKKGNKRFSGIMKATKKQFAKTAAPKPASTNEDLEEATNHAELAKSAHDAYVQATRQGNGTMAAHYLKQHTKHKADATKAREKAKAVKEETGAPVNNVGDGKIAGTQGDAGRKSLMKKKPLKRLEFKEFMEAVDKDPCWKNYKMVGMKNKNGKKVPNCVPESVEQQFDFIEEIVEEIALDNDINSEEVWEQLDTLNDEELLEFAIDAKGHKSSTGGLTQKGVDSYNKKTGGNLKTAVTTPPSKLKAGSKAANRRKSFCARMGGVDGPMKKPNGEPTRKALALNKWNC